MFFETTIDMKTAMINKFSLYRILDFKKFEKKNGLQIIYLEIKNT